MARRGESAVLPQVHRLFGVGSVAGLSEGQLLERFLAGRDEVAFEALVTRYGPMVLGVCRRLLADAHEAEDAFQATFLILVRKAGSLRRSDLLEHWLYRVAYRVAARARAESFRRRAREQQGLEVLAESREKTDDLADLKQVLDREVGRLPEKYRTAIVLCDFEGRTNEEAARRLGCPVGTVRSRLSRGREHLRGRLTRLGLAPSAALLGAILAPEIATAAVPRRLIGATVLAARTFRAGKTASLGVVPASVLSLSEGVLQAMFLTKLKMTAAGLLALGLLATGVSVLAQQPAPNPAAEPDTSRLKEVERKIDRLLNLLDRPVQPPLAPTPPVAPSAFGAGMIQSPQPLPSPAVGPVPPGPNPFPPPPGRTSNWAGALPSHRMMTTLDRSPYDGQMSPADVDRLATVERRLDQVEKKLDQVIRQIGGLKSEDQRSPQGR
jgi:RNA polymerase sigma factor (sigma-70 family)